MDFNIDMWLNLVLRWFHIMAGISWIGTSFFFIWLDNHLQFHSEGGEGYVGKAWLFHGGGYYEVDKSLVAPQSILSSLHWFKWEAYLTWFSGFALLIVVYFWHAGIYMVDPSVAAIGVPGAIAIGIGTLVVGWLVYDAIWRWIGPNWPRSALGISLVLYIAAVWGLTHLLSGRAAYIESGALLGTIMAANVAFIIMPNQRKMYEANRTGAKVDPALSYRAKRCSTHNNYLTLPVVFMMISNHYAMTYSHAMNWLILVVLFFVGVGVDHFLNTRDKEHKGLGYAPLGVAFIGVVAMVFFTATPTRTSAAPVSHTGSATAPGSASAAAGTVSFATAQSIIEHRCQACHSAHPTSNVFTSAPAGIMFDTPEEIHKLAPRIQQMAVATHAMPLGNMTHMTDQERKLLGAWIAEGATIPKKGTEVINRR